MANPTRSKAKQGRGAARSIRVPGRLHEARSNASPREMIFPGFGRDRTRLIPHVSPIIREAGPHDEYTRP